MNKALKIGLITAGALVAVGGGVIAYSAVRNSRRKKREEQDLMAINELRRRELEAISSGRNYEATSAENKARQRGETPENVMVTPSRNFEAELNNSFDDLKGVTLYPTVRRENLQDPEGHPGGLGKATIRKSPEVNTKRNAFDYSNKLTVKSGGNTPIGKVVGETYDNFDPKMRWFKVRLPSCIEKASCDLCWNYTYCYGWVRADNVTFRPYRKKTVAGIKKDACSGNSFWLSPQLEKDPEFAAIYCKEFGGYKGGGTSSSFSGRMIQRYKTSYPLGAEVFPHFDGQKSFEHSDFIDDI